MEKYKSNIIDFTYQFVCPPSEITAKDKSDTAKILSIDFCLTVTINKQLYFQEELPAFEFYKALVKWQKKLLKNPQVSFQYYSIEYDEGVILEMLPFHQLARLRSNWSEAEVYNVFPHQYLVGKLNLLEKNLKVDIERYFNIEMKGFMRHIPYREQC